MDILVHMYRGNGSHVSKASVKNMPFIGSIATMTSCLYVEREDKGAKKSMLTQIADRQILAE